MNHNYNRRLKFKEKMRTIQIPDSIHKGIRWEAENTPGASIQNLVATYLREKFATGIQNALDRKNRKLFVNLKVSYRLFEGMETDALYKAQYTKLLEAVTNHYRGTVDAIRDIKYAMYCFTHAEFYEEANRLWDELYPNERIRLSNPTIVPDATERRVTVNAPPAPAGYVPEPLKVSRPILLEEEPEEKKQPEQPIDPDADPIDLKGETTTEFDV